MLNVLKKEDVKLFEERTLQLLVESYSNSARTVQIRGFTQVEQIIADHATNSDRSLGTQIVPITKVPISLTVRTAQTSVSRGECYVKISLRVEGVVVGLLMAGYVTDTDAPAFPNGKIENSTDGPGVIRSIAGTDPAAGAEISETVPTGARWKILGIRATLVTDATAISRRVRAQIDDGVTTITEGVCTGAQTASLTVGYTIAKFGADYGVISTSAMVFLPQEQILPGASRIRTATDNLQAADNWGAPQLLVEEWIEP